LCLASKRQAIAKEIKYSVVPGESKKAAEIKQNRGRNLLGMAGAGQRRKARTNLTFPCFVRANLSCSSLSAGFSSFLVLAIVVIAISLGFVPGS